MSSQQHDNVKDIVNKRFVWKEGDPELHEPDDWTRFRQPNGSASVAPPQSDRVAVMKLVKRKAMTIDGVSVKPYALTAAAARDDLKMKVNSIVDITGYGDLRTLTTKGFRATTKTKATAHIPQPLNLALQYKNRTLLGDLKSPAASHSPSRSPSPASWEDESAFGTNQGVDDVEATFQDVMDRNQNDSDACSYEIGNYNQHYDAALPRFGSENSDAPSTGFGQGFGQHPSGGGSVTGSGSRRRNSTFEYGSANSVMSPEDITSLFDGFAPPPCEYSTEYAHGSKSTKYGGYGDNKFGSGNTTWRNQGALPSFGSASTGLDENYHDYVSFGNVEIASPSASDGNQSPHSMTVEEVNLFSHHPKSPQKLAAEEFHERAWGTQEPDAFDANKYREQEELDTAIAASLEDLRSSLPDASWEGASDDFVEVSDAGYAADDDDRYPDGTLRF
jgi:hypothetical protein